MRLSVLIPARNEMFLQRTIDDVVEHSGAESEVIVVLDGYWPAAGIPQHDRLSIIHRPSSIGQRAAVNEAARVSTAPYIMKLDAHCSVAPAFDAVLLEAAETLPEDVLQVPRQYNLHAFDWVCDCGWRRYQGSTPEKCEKCGGTELRRDMVWRPRKSRLTTAWRFDQELHFQYWSAYQRRPEGRGELTETMSLLGACWFVSRDRFWAMDGLDEKHGSWGQMGTELACKSWLSGGRVLCNQKTWFAHLFRTQGGDFGFPYPIKASAQKAARAYSQDLWRKGKWPKATRPLSWLIQHFAPLPDWEGGEATDAGNIEDSVPARSVSTPEMEPRVRGNATATRGSVSKGIVYYSDCRGDQRILDAARNQISRAANGQQIVSACLDVVPFGDIRVTFAHLERGYLTMFRQILAGLELSDADVIYFCEHDVLYHPSHFEFMPPDRTKVYYNENVWKVAAESGRALHYRCRQTSGLCAHRDILLEHYRKRVRLVAERGFSRKMGFEPGTHGRAERVDDLESEAWMSAGPNVDIRHGHNLTPSRWRKDQFRHQRYTKGWREADEVPGWGRTRGRFDAFLAEVTGGKLDAD